ncbi:PAS domain S-box protein [Haloarchaeobius salinus]|uniref:PAS domain S-box protein n=1 Tax=Haloarchaeobius salinus TaxID=1198298 RepID=UPI00210E290C|nr:PAS domain S-box protein [Haloarchaeobius salinus]
MNLSGTALQAVIDQSPDGLVVLGREAGRVEDCNSRFADLVGSECQSLRGRALAEIVEQRSSPSSSLFGELQALADSGATTGWVLRTDAGGAVSVEVRVAAVEATAGEDPRYFVVRTTATTDTEAMSRKLQAIDTAPIGISLSDPGQPDNPLVYVNEGFEELTGYSESDVVGRNCRFLQGEGTAREPAARLRRGIDAEEPVTVELRNYRQDGSEFWNRVTVAPVRSDDGTVSSFVGFQQDITEQKRYEQQLGLTSELLETVPSGVFRTTPDPEGTFEYLNPGLVSLLGAESDDQLAGRSVVEFYAEPSDREDLIAALYDADSNQVKREEQLLTVDGETIDVAVTASLYQDDDGTDHIHKVAQDITERKEYERRLEAQRDDLEMLNEILRHDIRNDLQLVTAYAESLASHVDDSGMELLRTVQETASHAVELTLTARNMSEVMLSAEENTEPVDLQRTLERAVEDARTEYTDAEVTLEESVPRVSVEGNDLLGSVFRNLLANAVEHNAKVVPEVHVSVTERAEAVRVNVADDGPGIPDDRKDAVFGKGEKGLGSDGTGIGLYLVDTLVDIYGGEVWVEDGAPTGSVFVVELPKVEPPE